MKSKLAREFLLGVFCVTTATSWTVAYANALQTYGLGRAIILDLVDETTGPHALSAKETILQ